MAHHRLAKATRRTALSVALGLCFASVHAQAPVGSVNGRAASGDTVVIENPGTGFRREIGVGADGSFRVSSLPPGTYRVTARRADGSTQTRTVAVSIGTGTSVDFAAAPADATTLEAIEVIGTAINPIDVSSVESTTVFTSERIAKIPVPRDITNVALLAPGTTKGDQAFGNLASFGGASVAENGYFVNGFNITNSYKGLNFADVPFEAIGEQQVKTGGYGAEFGRVLGGVVNIVTKRGTNDFKAGGNIYWMPKSLAGNDPNIFFNDGRLAEDNSEDAGWQAIASAWASGPLIRDTLFGYALIQYEREERDGEPEPFTEGDNDRRRKVKSPTWLVKLDWNITDNHLLEFTGFSDKREVDDDRFQFVGPTERGPYLGTEFTEQGGENYILKYTGYLTDTFTLSALYGYGEFKRNNSAVSASGIRTEYFGDIFGPVSGCPTVTDNRPRFIGTPERLIGCDFAGLLTRADAQDTRRQFRVDAEWQLGDHLLRAGIDTDKYETVDGEAAEGGVSYVYRSVLTTDGTATEDLVRETFFRNGATVEVDSEAYYIEDSWSITDSFMGYLGLRWDSFENKNGAGETYVEQKDQFAPRLGFSWDVNGDSSLKIFGNAGRYALPIASTVAIRGSSASRFESRDFIFTGVDPVTEAPTGLTPIPTTDPRCLENGGSVRCSPFFANNEFGVAKNAASIASENLDPQYQDEFILGFQKAITDEFSLGARGIYRELKRGIDDQCDYRPVYEWALENGFVDPDGNPFESPADSTVPNEIAVINPGFPFCRMYNPGSDGIFNMDINGDGTLEKVRIPADVLGPKAKRNYMAVEVFFEGNWDKFFLQGSYTYARSYGNYEGGVKSDIGQDDTGVTQDFDYPELTLGANGYLPNDRRHTIKVFGSYEITEEWSVGANLLIQSGRPINCFGVFDDDPVGYGASYFSCHPGVPGDADGDGVVSPGEVIGDASDTTIVTRGSAGRTPWIYTVDLNVAYRPVWAEGLTFKVDIFNAFDGNRALAVDEFGEDNANNPLFSTTYRTPTVFQDPRAVRFMVQYEF